jgi:IrrE N-terminal-like domain
LVAQPNPILDVPPELRLAQRLVERRHLVPPVDVESILREYATVEYVDFPVVIDGLCLDLKAIGKRPTVMVSRRTPLVRQRFTLAHELGHVLIPWHIGSIIDQIDVIATSEDAYFAIEAEANRFASELLMPTSWVNQQFVSVENPLDALLDVTRIAAVSLQAASIKFINCLPPNYVIARSDGGRVKWSSRSVGTLAATVGYDTNLNATNPYPFHCDMWTTRTSSTSSYHIWRFTTLTDVTVDTDQRPWREILDEIVSEIVPDKSGQQKFKASINGVTSNANGMVRKNRHHNVIATAMLQRLHASAAVDWKYKELVEHPKFPEFCNARAFDYAQR